MSILINGEEFTTFADYMDDENKVSKSEKALIEFEVTLIRKLIESREEKGAFSKRTRRIK